MKITLRQATEQDYTTYCNLLNEINDQHRAALPDIFQRPSGAIFEREYFISLLANADLAIFLAETEGRPAGFVHVLVREAPSYPLLVPRRIGIIDTLVVSAALRRGGVGKALMRKAEEWAASRGAAAVELNVYEFNQGAQAFYRRMGYTTLSRKMSKPLK
jgi:ribosomal protein S18 acetylase RimI-like enzyme